MSNKAVRLAALGSNLIELRRLVEEEGVSLHGDDHETAPLHAAAAENHTHILTYLLDKCGIDVNLIFSCCNGALASIKLLLDREADPTLADDSRMTPLLLASYNGHICCKMIAVCLVSMS